MTKRRMFPDVVAPDDRAVALQYALARGVARQAGRWTTARSSAGIETVSGGSLAATLERPGHLLLAACRSPDDDPAAVFVVTPDLAALLTRTASGPWPLCEDVAGVLFGFREGRPQGSLEAAPEAFLADVEDWADRVPRAMLRVGLHLDSVDGETSGGVFAILDADDLPPGPVFGGEDALRFNPAESPQDRLSLTELRARHDASPVTVPPNGEDDDALAARLAVEYPEVAALALSCLAPDRADRVLVAMPDTPSFRRIELRLALRRQGFARPAAPALAACLSEAVRGSAPRLPMRITRRVRDIGDRPFEERLSDGVAASALAMLPETPRICVDRIMRPDDERDCEADVGAGAEDAPETMSASDTIMTSEDGAEESLAQKLARHVMDLAQLVPLRPDTVDYELEAAASFGSMLFRLTSPSWSSPGAAAVDRSLTFTLTHFAAGAAGPLHCPMRIDGRPLTAVERAVVHAWLAQALAGVLRALPSVTNEIIIDPALKDGAGLPGDLAGGDGLALVKLRVDFTDCGGRVDLFLPPEALREVPPEPPSAEPSIDDIMASIRSLRGEE